MSSIEVGVIGSGGREHELGRQLALADEVSRVHFLDGNTGTDAMPKGVNVPIKPMEIKKGVDYFGKMGVGLVVVGPEAPLVAGISDHLEAQDILVFGPSAEAAQLEASKAYATTFMRTYGIPHPPAEIILNYNDALDAIAGRLPGTYVIKADGLAGGKGVVLPDTDKEAVITLGQMFIAKEFDGAGKDTVLVQDRFHGPEVSVFVVSDGKNFTILPFAQDHKRLQDGDKGPNTGGMGAYSPVPGTIVSARQEQKIYEIAEKSITGMAHKGTPYKGVLYIGVMLAEELGGDPAVIEYNARFGDPETQVILPPVSEIGISVYELLRSAAEGKLTSMTIPRNLGTAALTVCLAADGYPDNPKKGALIHGLDQDYQGVIIHHAGTKRNPDGSIVTAGGRVLYVTGLGTTLEEAEAHAYNAIGPIHFDGMQYRTDIGHQARK